jgi:hypothetical protein
VAKDVGREPPFPSHGHKSGMFGESRWTGARLHTLVTQELLPYRDGREEHVRINGPTVTLGPNTAQAIAISLHELATNAAKYGSLWAADGDVEIALSSTAGGQLSLRWTASGGPTLMSEPNQFWDTLKRQCFWPATPKLPRTRTTCLSFLGPGRNSTRESISTA